MRIEEFIKASSYRSDFNELEIELGHIPDYDEEQESEIGEIKIQQTKEINNGMQLRRM